MKTIKQSIEILISIAVLLAITYMFAPKIYAHAWQLSDGLLPATARISQACPNCFFDVQQAKLVKAEGQLKKQRNNALALTASNQKRIVDYSSKVTLGEAVLLQAKSLYNESPAAAHYALGGRLLDRVHFDAQVLFTSTELAAVKASMARMNGLQQQEQKIWTSLAKATAEVNLKQAEMQTARVEYQTSKILGDMAIDWDGFNTEIEGTKSVIRDLDELAKIELEGHSVVSLAQLVKQSDVGSTNNNKLSALTLQILSPTH
jgi:hypothetical protein